MTFLGKPDVFFSIDGVVVILDWKVNGYCSIRGFSPLKGYSKIRDGWDSPPSRSNNNTHKDCIIDLWNGMEINVASGFEDIKPDWAMQCSIYAWLMGVEVGGDFIIMIDQLACRGGKIRVAEHRNRVGEAHQKQIFNIANDLWEIVNSDWIFRNMGYEESKGRCEILDMPIEQTFEGLSNAKTWW